MKVKELIEKLLSCKNQDADVGYEHCYVDYVFDEGDYVEMGDARPEGYTRWVSYEKYDPQDYLQEGSLYIIAAPNDDGWSYYMPRNCPYGTNVLTRMGAMWLYCEEAPENGN